MSRDTDTKLAEKRAFFRRLDALDRADGDVDAGYLTALKEAQRSSSPQSGKKRVDTVEVSTLSNCNTTTAAALPHLDFFDCKMRRRNTDSSLDFDHPGTKSRDRCEETERIRRTSPQAEVERTRRTSRRTEIERPRTSPARITSSLASPFADESSSKFDQAVSTIAEKKPAMVNKRKRHEQMVPAPKEKRVFSGLVFFYVPNNDIAGPRKFRIQKAQQYGANRAMAWKPSVTHIIVDSGIPFKDVIKVLQQEVPDHVIVVNESWTADCIAQGCLVNPNSKAYRVLGMACPQGKASTSLVPDDVPGPSWETRKKITVAREQYTPERPEEKAATEVAYDPVAAEIGSKKIEFCDAFEQAIAETKATMHLIKFEEEDETELGQAEGEGELGKFGSTFAAKTTWQQAFTCMKANGGTDQENNPNARTIQLLQEMANYYESTQDTWRTIAYRKAISQLKRETKLISTKEEAILIPYIGVRLADKIEEIVRTDRLQRLENTNLEPSEKAFKLFLGIYGVGYTLASQWAQKGYRSLEELLRRDSAGEMRLTTNQKLGIAHYEDLKSRIPRKEVDEHGQIVRNALAGIDRRIQATIGGSYRRGAKDSGDIDVVITKRDASITYIRTVVLEQLVPTLFNQGYLTAGLAVTSPETGTKWHGACQLPSDETSGVNTNPWRRVDFLLVPWSEIGAAMIYFTGNDIFNRSMRLLARKKGMRLNQRGLYKEVLRDQQQKKLTEGTLLEGQSERRIFELLGVPWRHPTMRNC